MVGGILNIGGTNLITVVGGSAAGGDHGHRGGAHVRPHHRHPDRPRRRQLARERDGTILPGGRRGLQQPAVRLRRLQHQRRDDQHQIWEFNPAAAAGARWTLKTATLPAPRGLHPHGRRRAASSTWPAASDMGRRHPHRHEPVAALRPRGGHDHHDRHHPAATGETRAVSAAARRHDLGARRRPRRPQPERAGGRLPPRRTNTWSRRRRSLNARRNFPADIDPADGRIFGAGGYDVGGCPNHVTEQFTCTIPVDLMTFGVE